MSKDKNLSNFISIVSKLKVSSKLYKLLKLSDSAELSVKILHGSSASVFIADLWRQHSLPLLIIAADADKSEEIYHDMHLLADASKTANISRPSKSVKYHENGSIDNFAWLIDGLKKSLSHNDGIAVATPEILKLEIPDPNQVLSDEMSLRVNQNIDFEELIRKLIMNGFERQDYVAQQGDIAIRGGILDVFPIAWDNPIRIEFWGNDIESIREFNVVTQRSVRSFDKVDFISNIYHTSTADVNSTIFDYLPQNTLVILYEPDLLDIDYDDITEYRKVKINPLAKSDLLVKTEPQPNFQGTVKSLVHSCAEYAALGYSIVITSDGKLSKNRIRDLFLGSMQNASFEEFSSNGISKKDLVNKIIWLDNTLSKGFVDHDNRLMLITEHEIFDRQRRREKKIKRSAASYSLQEIRQLNVGDYVVHEDKGIGRFEGFQTVKIGGSKQDCMKLMFAEESVLYVNLNYIHKIQKYSAAEGVLPKLSKLGTTEWARKKSKTKRRLKDIARDLIKIYAKRKMQEGFSFPADDVWQKEFEASFVYEDTPDQAKSTDDIKADMEASIPMDRLVCGDVGFGKTEVAIRAAFKAVQAGKQVSVLVPTTILAQQHYMSFKDRISRYPIHVDVISRFRTPKQQKEIIENVKEGKTDILIGTHRLLSKDINFKDLGLLIIDEEHRFGVGAKEKLREFRSTIDTLTLTATPIPRTLNFSLMGARDLSLIETPPRNRIPVETEIIEWDQERHVEIIEKEISRGGQVFFVSDRVSDLEKIAMDMQMLMPDLRFGIAHGQMKTSELEKVMQDFIQGEYDVLVATKIIESGIDIPNANTIIINRANNFGLAELYQLRGRVGRTNKQAYCYLIIPPFHKIDSKALKRLQAVEEFTDLGSGFKLAMRDMEIRGAGNLLGAEQSGFIIDIGFDLFQKILEEAVQELRNEEFSDLFDSDAKPIDFSNEDMAIEIEGDSFLPQDYVEDNTERFNYYRRLFKIKKNDELAEMEEEIIDRFGKMPTAARNLMFAVKIRIAGMKTGFSKISLKNNQMICEFPSPENEAFYEETFPMLIDYIKEDLPQAKLRQSAKKLYLEMPLASDDQAVEVLWKLKRTVELI